MKYFGSPGMEYPGITVFQLDSLECIRGIVFCVSLISFEHVFENEFYFQKSVRIFIFLWRGSLKIGSDL